MTSLYAKSEPVRIPISKIERAVIDCLEMMEENSIRPENLMTAKHPLKRNFQYVADGWLRKLIEAKLGAMITSELVCMEPGRMANKLSGRLVCSRKLSSCPEWEWEPDETDEAIQFACAGYSTPSGRKNGAIVRYFKLTIEELETLKKKAKEHSGASQMKTESAPKPQAKGRKIDYEAMIKSLGF